MASSILVSGKLGDLIHSMYVANHLWVRHGQRSKIYITEVVEPFENGVHNTRKELRPIIRQQKGNEGFEIWEGQPIEYNTTLFRTSPHLYRRCWTEIMSLTFFPNDEPVSGAWMTYNEVRNWNDTLVINRRYKNPMSDHIRDSYLMQIQQHEKTIFLGSQHDYDLFPLKDMCQLVVPQTMEDWFTYIAKCNRFMGNQSAPLAIASALNTPRIAELLPTQYPDWVHYWGEDKYGDIYLVQ
jgi:hypothetical protein